MIDSLYQDGEIRFLLHFSTRGGRYISNRLNLKGKSAEKISNSLSGFFWNLQAAITVKNLNEMKANKITNPYVNGCKMIYEEILENPQYMFLPKWVKDDLIIAGNFLSYEK